MYSANIKEQAAKVSGHSFVVLDGMRVAAMAVVTYHVDLDFGEPRWFPSAYLAVDLFFVLSGFVLAHAYEHRFASGMTTWQFMLLRLIEFYPFYLLALFVPLTSLLAADLAGHDSGSAFIPFFLRCPGIYCFCQPLRDGGGRHHYFP